MVGVVVFASSVYCALKGELEDICTGFVIFLNLFCNRVEIPL